MLRDPERHVNPTADAGCCGMAGVFGFGRQHDDVSMRVGERVAPRIAWSAEARLRALGRGPVAGVARLVDRCLADDRLAEMIAETGKIQRDRAVAKALHELPS